MNSDTHTLQTYWWALTLRGIFAVLFGIAAVFWPGITILTLIYLFSAWILVDAVVRVVTGIVRVGEHQLGFLTMVVGLLELGVGVYLLRHPHVTFATLILLIGFVLIVAGVIEGVSALTSKESDTSKIMSVIIGVAALLAGILMLFQPSASGVAFVWIIGLYALIAGPIMIAMSIEIHHLIDAKQKK